MRRLRLLVAIAVIWLPVPVAHAQVTFEGELLDAELQAIPPDEQLTTSELDLTLTGSSIEGVSQVVIRRTFPAEGCIFDTTIDGTFRGDFNPATSQFVGEYAITFETVNVQPCEGISSYERTFDPPEGTFTADLNRQSGALFGIAFFTWRTQLDPTTVDGLFPDAEPDQPSGGGVAPAGAIPNGMVRGSGQAGTPDGSGPTGEVDVTFPASGGQTTGTVVVGGCVIDLAGEFDPEAGTATGDARVTGPDGQPGCAIDGLELDGQQVFSFAPDLSTGQIFGGIDGGITFTAAIDPPAASLSVPEDALRVPFTFDTEAAANRVQEEFGFDYAVRENTGFLFVDPTTGELIGGDGRLVVNISDDEGFVETIDGSYVVLPDGTLVHDVTFVDRVDGVLAGAGSVSYPPSDATIDLESGSGTFVSDPDRGIEISITFGPIVVSAGTTGSEGSVADAPANESTETTSGVPDESDDGGTGFPAVPVAIGAVIAAAAGGAAVIRSRTRRRPGSSDALPDTRSAGDGLLPHVRDELLGETPDDAVVNVFGEPVRALPQLPDMRGTIGDSSSEDDYYEGLTSSSSSSSEDDYYEGYTSSSSEDDDDEGKGEDGDTTASPPEGWSPADDLPWKIPEFASGGDESPGDEPIGDDMPKVGDAPTIGSPEGRPETRSTRGREGDIRETPSSTDRASAKELPADDFPTPSEPPPPIPSDTHEEDETKHCGPDVTVIYLAALNRIVRRMRSIWQDSPDPPNWEIEGIMFLNNNGPFMDFRLKVDPNSPCGRHCPGAMDEEKYLKMTFNGKCYPLHYFSDTIFGLTVGLLGVNQWIASAGARYAEYKEHGSAFTAGEAISQRMYPVASDLGARVFDGGEVRETDVESVFAASDVASDQRCRPCPVVAYGNQVYRDFSTRAWEMDYGTDKYKFTAEDWRTYEPPKSSSGTGDEAEVSPEGGDTSTTAPEVSYRPATETPVGDESPTADPLDTWDPAEVLSSNVIPEFTPDDDAQAEEPPLEPRPPITDDNGPGGEVGGRVEDRYEALWRRLKRARQLFDEFATHAGAEAFANSVDASERDMAESMQRLTDLAERLGSDPVWGSLHLDGRRFLSGISILDASRGRVAETTEMVSGLSETLELLSRKVWDLATEEGASAPKGTPDPFTMSEQEMFGEEPDPEPQPDEPPAQPEDPAPDIDEIHL